ncbi:MAG TPA: efflux RND transporter periplasmic adaptor subunit [Thermoanaerobaculia bacterium]|nr:efflux RND transporter periplasmic adaptor subunit [Thermoanaerobaculia bacterium]
MKRALILTTVALVCACAAKKTRPADDRVAVTVATAEQKNIPIQLRAIGTVQPLQTVAIRALVGGQLTRVSFNEGDDVRQGDMLFTIDPRPYQATLAQAEANLARDEAQARNAESERARYGDLVKKDYVTKEEYEKISSGADAARAVVAADRAAVETARLQLSYCAIHAPIDGRTGTLLVHLGNLVKANDTTALVVINKIRPVYVQFAVPESQLGPLRATGLTNVPVSAAPQGSNRVEAGKLTFVDNAVDPQTGTITLKGTFGNEDAALWPGQYVNVAVTLSDRPNAVVVPAQAVQNGQRGQYVYVVKRDNGVEMRPVTVAQQIEQQVVIDRGVTAGETVVTDGQLKLTPKSKVEIKHSL